MRPYVPLLLLTSALAGCASSASGKPKPIRTARPVNIVATVPMSTPVAVKHHTLKPYHGPKIKALPTVKPYTRYKAPTPIPIRDFTAILQGKVTDAKTGSPVAGALVVVGQRPRHTTTTNSFGQYRVTFPAGPDIVVQVTKQGFAGQLAMGRIKQHGSSKVNFKLAPTSVKNPAAPSPPMAFGTP